LSRLWRALEEREEKEAREERGRWGESERGEGIRNKAERGREASG
jgi:hypothetical protein